jgi:hypothetical protein
VGSLCCKPNNGVCVDDGQCCSGVCNSASNTCA